MVTDKLTVHGSRKLDVSGNDADQSKQEPAKSGTSPGEDGCAGE